MEERELLMTSILFLLMFSIDRQEPDGKRIRKKIERALKTELAKARTLDREQLVRLVYASQDILARAKDRTDSDYSDMKTLNISPYWLLQAFDQHSMITSNVGITESDISELKACYSISGLVFVTKVYSNRLLEAVEDYLSSPNAQLESHTIAEIASEDISSEHPTLKDTVVEGGRLMSLVSREDVGYQTHIFK